MPGQRNTAAQYAIVCGFGHLGNRVAEQLLERGYRVLVIEKSLETAEVKRAEALGCELLEGDIREDYVLDLAEVSSATCFIAVTGDDRANLEAGIAARQRNSAIPVVVRLVDQVLARRVESAFAIQALSVPFLVSPSFVSAATDDAIIAMFNVDGCYLSLFQDGFRCAAGANESGVRIRKDGAALRIIPPAMQDIPGGECLVAALQRSPRRTRRPRRRSKADGAVLAARKPVTPQNPFHTLLEVWQHASAVTRKLLVALLAASALSVFIFTYFGHMSPLDAVYFVVTTLTTTGYGDINLQQAPALLKIYGILMMLCGAGLLATIYAIIADYVLSIRVEYLLGRRKIKLSDHTLVVGLGNVGYRVAHDLHLLGVPVVGVEVNEDSDNVHAAAGAFPVVIGNAGRASVLERAGVERAKVVLAVTDDAMVNLSVALHARERNPGIKTVVRTFESDLAAKLKLCGLDVVLSTSAIATPVFADMASYPWVHGSFPFLGSDILLARHIIDDHSPFCGKSVQAVSNELGMAIVLLASSALDEYRPAAPEDQLYKGQKVTVLLTREKIAQLAPQPVVR